MLKDKQYTDKNETKNEINCLAFKAEKHKEEERGNAEMNATASSLNTQCTHKFVLTAI